MNIPDQLPQLATGSHSRGSGKACIMNAISYLNGDTKITDMPDCAYYLLAKAAIRLNDQICTHRNNGILCPECSHEMWKIGARIIGSASAIDGWTDEQKHRLSVQLALHKARRVEHLSTRPEVKICNDTTRGWLEGTKSLSEVREAHYAAYAAYAAAYAAAADAAKRQYRIESVHGLIDEFDRLTGRNEKKTRTSQDFNLLKVEAGL